ncbi:hypothetical protein MTR67_030910 [Solanum verrucosum]|uniref:Uncharacterized protein n=1 Tax=Solanum verrucosum TaxID=315347 RepID=A0AAF0U1G3_SOLVR|nr:hypothetical protein MTR67_030910 [Solanum verrucosum]
MVDHLLGPATDHRLESPAEFFADNKYIAGFDNPGKCLYITMRELVENVDSAKSISKLPVVKITTEEISRCKFNSMIGLADHERRDKALYDDFEASKAREDNGRGMPHDDILNMFRRVLSGTKYGLKQTRGKFGLGAKMAR